MKGYLPALMLFCTLCAPAAAQQKPADVTDAQIRDYKATAVKGCREAGKSRGDPAASVEGFCGCMVAALEKKLSRAEWQQLSFYSVNSRPEDEMNVLAPHRKEIQTCSRRAPETKAEEPVK